MTTSPSSSSRQDQGSQDYPHGPHEILNHAEKFNADAEKRRRDEARAHELHTVAADALVARSRALRATLQEMHRIPSGAPEGLSAFREAFRQHYVSTQATVHPLLEQHDKASVAVQRDREDGAQLLRRLDDVIAGKVAVEGLPLTTQLVLGGIDQYLIHEERDLVPWMKRSLL